jgi:hypothetical protein
VRRVEGAALLGPARGGGERWMEAAAGQQLRRRISASWRRGWGSGVGKKVQGDGGFMGGRSDGRGEIGERGARAGGSGPFRPLGRPSRVGPFFCFGFFSFYISFYYFNIRLNHQKYAEIYK